MTGVRASAFAAFLVLGSLFVPPVVGCTFLGSPTKTARGQLYQSGDGNYDPYFAAVHQEQVEGEHRPDESKAARKAILAALHLRTGSSNTLVLAATRERKNDPALGAAIEQTTASENDIAHRFAVAAAKLDEMHKHGEELKTQADEERKNLGAGKADEKKVDRADTVKHELAAALDALESMTSYAKKSAKEAEELARKLKPAWTGKTEEDDRPAPKVEPEESQKPEPTAKKPSPKAETAKKRAPEVETRPSEKKPTSSPAPNEVFNP